MAGKKQFANGTWQYSFKRKGVLDKTLYLTFADEEEGDAYAQRLDALLDRGIVPTEHQPRARVLSLSELVREYERDAHPSQKDRSAIGAVLRAHGGLPVSRIDAAWVDAWISQMKRMEHLAPATIRARVGRWPGVRTGAHERSYCKCLMRRCAVCQMVMRNTPRPIPLQRVLSGWMLSVTGV